MLWVDKYRPLYLDEFILHDDLANDLKKFPLYGDFTHLLFHGPSGSGKKTLVMAFLRKLYGSQIDKARVESKKWDINIPGRSSKLEIDLTIISSHHHVEMNPSVAGHNDRHVVQTIIKEMAKNTSPDAMLNCYLTPPFKIFILNGVDTLSNDAQHCLRRTMENYSSGCRLIFCCNNMSKIMEQVHSRCTRIRVPAPKERDISLLLRAISVKENVKLSRTLASRIVKFSKRNLRKAILVFEACTFLNHPLKENMLIPSSDWELCIQEIANDIFKEQSPSQLLLVRGKLYELLKNCVPPELLIRGLLDMFLLKLDVKSKHEATKTAAFFDQRLQNRSEAIYHLEAFVAKVMYCQKKFLIQAFA